jgi:osmoprotectant transport system permease protein
MLSGDLDLYLEYTGTGFMVILQPSIDEINERIASEEKVFNYVRDSFATQHQLQWLEPLGFNNTYALMVRKELSQKKAWHKLSDLIAE